MSGRSAVTGAAFFTQMGRDENSSSAAQTILVEALETMGVLPGGNLAVPGCTYTHGQAHHGKNVLKNRKKWFQVRYWRCEKLASLVDPRSCTGRK